MEILNLSDAELRMFECCSLLHVPSDCEPLDCLNCTFSTNYETANNNYRRNG